MHSLNTLRLWTRHLTVQHTDQTNPTGQTRRHRTRFLAMPYRRRQSVDRRGPSARYFKEIVTVIIAGLLSADLSDADLGGTTSTRASSTDVGEVDSAQDERSAFSIGANVHWGCWWRTWSCSPSKILDVVSINAHVVLIPLQPLDLPEPSPSSS